MDNGVHIVTSLRKELFMGVASSNARTRTLSRLSICAFLLVHGLAHALSIGQATYEFSSTPSNLLIFGGSAFGALYLLLEAKQRFAAPA